MTRDVRLCDHCGHSEWWHHSNAGPCVFTNGDGCYANCEAFVPPMSLDDFLTYVTNECVEGDG